METPGPQLQELATWLREELQECTRVLRHRRDRAVMQQALARLRQAVQRAEAAVQTRTNGISYHERNSGALSAS